MRETNGSVLVHCLAGISRSPTVAIAYVMRHLHLTFDDAFRYVKSKRLTISPNFNFLGQLLEYERQLRAEEVLDSSVGDVSSACLPPPPLATHRTTTPLASPMACGREQQRISRSISLSLSLKSPGSAVLSSPDNPFGFSPDQVDGGGGGGLALPTAMTADLSPTTALARLSFEAMDSSNAPGPAEESGHSYLMVSRRRNLREESYRSTRQRLSTSSSCSSESHFYSQQKTETSQRSSSSSSTSHVVLTVSQSKRVTSGHPTAVPPSGRPRWKAAAAATSPDANDFCSEISVQIEGSARTGQQQQPPPPDQDDHDVDQVEIRRRGPGSCQRPHSDGGFRNLPFYGQSVSRSAGPMCSRRPSYAPSESSSSVISDELLLPPTPSSPPPGHHCLLSPQTSWMSSGGGMYARSDSVTTSGLGSEISDSDTRADDALSMCSGMSGMTRGTDMTTGEMMDSLPPDDGVFINETPPPPGRQLPLLFAAPPPSRSSRPRPSSLLGITPAKDLEWRPSCASHDVADDSAASFFPTLRPKGHRPPSLTSPPGFESDLTSNATDSTISGRILLLCIFGFVQKLNSLVVNIQVTMRCQTAPQFSGSGAPEKPPWIISSRIGKQTTVPSSRDKNKI